MDSKRDVVNNKIPMSPYQMGLKRAFDFTVSLLVLIFIWPILLMLTLGVKLTSPGPALFRQKRIGLHGKCFFTYKFRTMIRFRDKESTVTVAGDERITPFGRFLRRSKLDELPQLINIVRGDMSLVGPRPDVPGYADRLTEENRIILSVRPGVTGPATLMFRNEEKLLAKQANPEKYNNEVIFPEKVRLNRQYVENYSFWHDIKYIWLTIFL